MKPGGRGAGDRPLTYAGEYDPARTYLPREIVTLDGVPYMATALMQGVEPVPYDGGVVDDATYVIIRSPDSTAWRITVSDAGVLSVDPA